MATKIPEEYLRKKIRTMLLNGTSYTYMLEDIKKDLGNGSSLANVFIKEENDLLIKQGHKTSLIP